jgi:Fic family protein
MLERFWNFYGSSQILSTGQLVALAAAHHRMAWIHPFGECNGRVTRLYSHAWLVRCQADALGLWTLSRGLARHRKAYYENLHPADQKRWNDLDGRGNLSDHALGEFCGFLLKTMLDQIDFLAGLLQLPNLARRVERHVHFEFLTLDARTRNRLVRLLKAALTEGEIERGRVGEIVGLQGTAARASTRLALREELLSSSTEKGPLSIVFNSRTLESCFPKLYQDLPDEAP